MSIVNAIRSSIDTATAVTIGAGTLVATILVGRSRFEEPQETVCMQNDEYGDPEDRDAYDAYLAQQETFLPEYNDEYDY